MVDPAMFIKRDRARRSRPLLRTTLGRLLRRARLDQGRTLADVARAARISMPYLSELERGRKEASSEILAAVCEALRIDLADLLAAAGRELDFGRDRQPAGAPRPAVIRLDLVRNGLTPPPVPGSGDMARPDASDVVLPGSGDATLPGTGDGADPHDGATRRPGDAVCLLAA